VTTLCGDHSSLALRQTFQTDTTAQSRFLVHPMVSAVVRHCTIGEVVLEPSCNFMFVLR
jgi:hypothetical protein